MVIIGLNTSHTATACLLKDGKIIACVSEERLTRVKIQAGIPYLAIKDCLRIAGLEIDDVDYIVLNYKDPKVHAGFSAFTGEKAKTVTDDNLSNKQQMLSVFWHLKEKMLTLIPYLKYPMDYLLKYYYSIFIDPTLDKKVKDEMSKNLGIPTSKIIKAEHHDSHVYSAYFGSSFDKTVPTLIFTLDSMGDGICATVSIGQNGSIKRIARSLSGASIGDLYTQTTAYLGMKLGEHEYKVMGLAPYANRKHFEPLLEKLRKVVWINKNLSFETVVHSHMFYQILPKLYAYQRFDNIAGALQSLTEEVLCQWIDNAISKTGISQIVCAGGVFMNVKMNQKVLELPSVKKLFIVPSAADESTALGSAYWAHATKANWLEIEPIDSLYLGGEFSQKEIDQALKKTKYQGYKKEIVKDLEKKVAALLAKGEIVARFSGRMEFGARSLGNRSILAHPSRLEVISEINDQIKSRDFWMPFAPSILNEDKDKYFINRKQMEAPYMIITFDSTPQGEDQLKAAMHQYDHTLRPQIVTPTSNSSYYKLIKEFKNLTGIGGVLNTSFNLHGFPVVYTPEDALGVFKDSGLKYLALGPFLVSKF